ncbi:hydrolase (plasmid) [Azospirillum sp. B510]|uniref:dienelactone hydrolase family protein n=1 Tax=Azospirillum sp. (strain B510) TaxID=137722 RepID=UPI0001C4BCA6|nr:dienelactone hydrolase family protein [Azospirillum sp. B510]BAI73544.1 hydrolase [Azospirillum sp. B510]
MKRRLSVLALAASVLLPLGLSSAVQAAEGAPQRTEAIPFATETMSDVDFLKGGQGTPATIAGVLRLPSAGTAKVPLVIMLHGSSGYLSYIDAWVDRMTKAGIASFVIDSFSGRGLTSVRDDQASLGRLAGTLDAFRALETLSKHPRIDPERIVLMGFSRGGQGALYSSVERFQAAHHNGPSQFAGFISFYPNCSTRYIGDETLVKRPVRVFHGMADDFNAFAPCQSYVERLKAAGQDVALNAYPDSHHVFDWADLKTPLVNPKAQSVRNCRIAETEAGVITNLDTGKPFSYQDACVAQGTTAAYNEPAAIAAEAGVRDFLKSLFKL